jgi:hypothetical protein
MLLLLLPLLLLFLRHVMPYRTTGGRAYDSVMSGDMPGYAANNGAFETTLRLRPL